MKTSFAGLRCIVRFGLLQIALPVSGAEIIWTNTSGGNWNATSNWLTHFVPSSGDNVYITNAGTYTVTLNTSATVQSLVIGGSNGIQRLTNSAVANLLTIGAASSVELSGVLGIANGALSGSGDLTVRGQFVWSGGTVSGLGQLVIADSGNLSIAGTAAKILSGRNVINSGRIDWAGIGNISFNVGVITNASTGVIELQNNEPISDADGTASPATLYNLGTLRKVTGTGTSTFTALTIQNAGVISVQSGTLTLAGTFNNSGTCEVVSGTLNLTGTGTHSGTFDAAAVGAITFSAGAHTLSAGTHFTGPGTHRLSAAAASATLTGAVDASTFEVTAGTLAGSGDLTVTNLLHWSGGTFSGSGSINLAPTAALTIDGAASKILSGRTFNLSAAGTWSGTGPLQFNSGVFNVFNGGLLDAQNDELFSDTDGANTSATINISTGGTFRKSVGTLTTALTGVALNNSGTVEVQSGTLAISGGTSTGRFDASTPAAIISFASGTHTVQGGALLLGTGIHRVNGTTAALTVSGVAGANQFELVSGTVNTSGTLTISNSFSWSGGTLGGSGTVLLPANSTCGISGTTVKVLNGPTLNNAGTVTWTGIGDIQFSAGVLRNQPGAVFEVQNGEPITDSDPATSAVFENAGTFRKTVATTSTTFNGVLFNNSGLVEVQSGTLSLAGGNSSGLFMTTVPGALITVATGNHVLAAGAAVTGPGLCRLTGSITTLSAEGSVGIDRMEIASGTLTGTGTLTVTNSLDWLSGTMSGSGTTVISPSATLNLSGAAGRTLNGRTLLNRGAATWTSTANLNFNNGTFQNAAGAVFEAQNDRSISDNDGGATPALFINEGTFRKTVGTGTTGFNGVPFNNSGLVDVQSGTFSLAGGTSTGTFAASAPASVVSFGSGTNILNTGAVLQGSGSFNLSGFSTALDVEGNITAPRFDMSAGTLAGSGTLTVTGAFNWSGGTIAGNGSLELPASSVLNMAAPFGALTLAGRTINNSSRAVWSGASDFNFNSGVFNNLAGGVFEIQNDRSLSDTDGASTVAVFRNYGVIQKTVASGQTSLFNVGLTNSGSINVTNWSLTLNGPFSNDGTCTVANGSVTIQGDGSSGGLFSTLTPSSRISFFSGNQQWREGARLVGLGTNEVQFSTIDIAGAVGIDNLELVGSGTLTGGGTLNVSNSFRWTFGSLSGTGATTVLPAATLWLTGNGSRVLDGRTLNNRGTAHVGGALGTISLNRGTFKNDTGALFDISADTSIDDSDGAVTTSLFVNAGTLRCSGTSGLTAINTVPLTNSGSIQVLSGALQIGGPFTHTGVCALTNGSLNLEGGGASSGTFNFDSASTVDFAGGDFSFNPGTTFLGEGLVRITGATVNSAAALPITRLQQDGGTLTGAGTITIGKLFTWLGGTQAGSGVTSIAAAAALNVTNNGSASLNGRTLRNAGKAISTSPALIQGILFNSGVIENLANATFEAQTGGGFYDFDGLPSVPEFRNAGTFIRTTTGTASFSGVTFTNSGSVLLDSGGSQFGNYTQTAGSTALAGTMIALGVNLNGGTLTGAGTIQCVNLVNSAVISPGTSAGTIVLFGPYLQTPQGKLSIEVGGTASSLFDSLQVSGAVTLSGLVDISIINGYQPVVSDFIPIITATQVSGEFASVTGGAVGADKALRPEYTFTSVLLKLQDATNSTTVLSFAQPVAKPNGDIQLTLNGTANATFTLQASTNLFDWVNLVSATNPGPSFIYTITNVGAFPAQFFRAR